MTRNNQTGQEKHILYIGGSPYESNIIFVKNYTESSGSYKFLHKDYLGSILAISDEAGNKLEQRHYDASGNLTHLQINGGAIKTDENQIRDFMSNGGLLIDRGYTSHEHFAEVGLIHMNGRLYDPLLRRFLNADENIQDMFNTQNYNKYGYVLNNPLMFSDPSGEFIGIILGIVLNKAFLIGAAVGAASYLITAAVMKQKITFGGFLKAIIFGGISGYAAWGIGEIFSTAAKSFGNALLQAGAHGLSQGVLGVVQGQNFLSAVAGGFLGSIGATGFGKIVGDWAGKAGGQIFFGALSGGIGAELAGGNFWQGAMIGGIVAGLNHTMHRPKTSFKVYDDDGTYVGKMRIAEYRTVTYDDGSMSTEIDLRFTPTKNSGYDSFEWVQTVSKNEYGKYTVFNDPLPGSAGHDSSPYYWDKAMQAEMYNVKTNTYRFYDSPRREANSMYNAYWRGEVSLVGINSSGAHALSTFKWGFNYYQNGHYLSMPLMSIPYSGRYKWLK